MAIRAHDLALLNFSEYYIPWPVLKVLPDVETLVAQVVEIEDHGIGLAAVDARVTLEVFDQVRSAVDASLPVPNARSGDVPRPVRQVVLAHVFRGAAAAIAVAPTLQFVFPRELCLRLGLAAARTTLHRLKIRRRCNT